MLMIVMWARYTFNSGAAECTIVHSPTCERDSLLMENR